MNRTTSRRASIAAAAIVAGLVLGAGGLTIANWTTTKTAADGTITIGDLDLTVGDATWKDISDGVTPRDFNVATDSLVPNETLQREQPVDVTLKGERLSANLALTGGAFDKTIDGLTVTYALKDSGGTIRATATNNALTATFASSRAEAKEGDIVAGTGYKLVTTVKFAADAQTGANQSVKLGGSTLKLTQGDLRNVAPPAQTGGEGGGN